MQASDTHPVIYILVKLQFIWAYKKLKPQEIK
jgi:hypothetical protein